MPGSPTGSVTLLALILRSRSLRGSRCCAQGMACLWLQRCEQIKRGEHISPRDLTCDVCACKQVTEDAIARLLPFILNGLKATCPKEQRMATYMIIMQLISRSTPAPQLFNGALQDTAIVALGACSEVQHMGGADDDSNIIWRGLPL